MPDVKSAIREVRDQLFLDRADGEYLSAVSANIGMDRPLFGFADDEVWRAIVRRLALDYKQVLPVFYDLLAIIFGPQKTATLVLERNAAIGDETLYLAEDWLTLPQRGTLVLDEGLASEESVEYSFRDPSTGEVELKSALVNAHTALTLVTPIPTDGSGAEYAENLLAVDAVTGDGTITVEDGDLFPDPVVVGNYPILLGAGDIGTRSGVGDSFAAPAAPEIELNDAAGVFTSDLVGRPIRIAGATSLANDGLFIITRFISATQIAWVNAAGVVEAFVGTWVVENLQVEEIVEVSGIAANVISFVTTLLNDHPGPRATPMTTPYTAVSPSAMQVFGTDINEFPGSGLLQLQEDGGAPSEFVRYGDKDNDTLLFDLNSPLAGAYTTAMITLAQDGSKVQLAQVQVKGVGWDARQTEPNLLNLYLPEILEKNRLIDASYLHDAVANPPAIGTTLATAAQIGDLVLDLTSGTGFPSSGVLVIDLAGVPEYIGYSRRDQLSAVLYTSDASQGLPAVAKTVPSGALELYVSDVTPFVLAAELGYDTAVIDPTGVPETVTIKSIDEAESKLVLASATVAAHNTVDNVHDVIEAGNQLTGSQKRGPDALHLMRPLTAVHAALQTVDLFRVQYAGEELEDGQIYTAALHRYQGPYIWSPADKAPRSTDVAGNPVVTTLAEDVAGPTDLIASSRANRTALEAKDASLWRKVGSDYQRVQVGRGLGGREVRTISNIVLQKDVLLTMGAAAAPGAMSITVSAAGLPNARGYRLFIGDDQTVGAAAEIVIVEEVVGATVTLSTPIQNNHTFPAGDQVRLLADVLVVDALAYDHEGLVPIAQLQNLLPGMFTDTSTSITPGIILLEDRPIGERVATLEEIRAYVDVVSAALFPTSGNAQLNMGREVLPYESRINQRVVGPIAGSAFAVAGTTVTLTDAGAAFTAADVGKIVKVRRATSPANDGNFIITAQGGTTIDYENTAPGIVEGFGATTVYEVSGMPPAAATVTVEDGSGFPTANFFVKIGGGSRIAEIVEVASRVADVLTFAVGTDGDPVFLHGNDDWIAYEPGEQEEIPFTDTDTGGANERFIFDEELGHYFDNQHFSGEPVDLVTQQAIPREFGNEYPFYLPSSWEDRLEFLFDLARAAGVKVILTSDV